MLENVYKELTQMKEKHEVELRELSDDLNNTRDNLKETEKKLNRTQVELGDAKEQLEETNEEVKATRGKLNETIEDLNVVKDVLKTGLSLSSRFKLDIESIFGRSL